MKDDDKKVHSDFGNSFWIFSPRRCQSLYDVKQKDRLVSLAISFLITLTKVAEKNLRAYKDISNETIYSQINLAGQYL